MNIDISALTQPLIAMLSTLWPVYATLIGITVALQILKQITRTIGGAFGMGTRSGKGQQREELVLRDGRGRKKGTMTAEEYEELRGSHKRSSQSLKGKLDDQRPLKRGEIRGQRRQREQADKRIRQDHGERERWKQQLQDREWRETREGFKKARRAPSTTAAPARQSWKPAANDRERLERLSSAEPLPKD